MTTIKELVAKIKEARALAKVNIEDIEPRLQAGVEGKIRAAARDAQDLENSYKNEILKGLQLVAIKGARAHEFAEANKDILLCVSANLIVDELTDAVQKRSQQSTFGGQELNFLNGELGLLRERYGILSLPPIQDKGLAADTAYLPMRDAIALVLEKNYGKQLHSLAIRNYVANLALESLHEGANLVVGVLDYDGLDEEFLPPVAAVVSTTDDPFDKQVLEKIKQSITGLAKGEAEVKTRSKRTAKAAEGA